MQTLPIFVCATDKIKTDAASALLLISVEVEAKYHGFRSHLSSQASDHGLSQGSLKITATVNSYYRSRVLQIILPMFSTLA